MGENRDKIKFAKHSGIYTESNLKKDLVMLPRRKTHPVGTSYEQHIVKVPYDDCDFELWIRGMISPNFVKNKPKVINPTFIDDVKWGTIRMSNTLKTFKHNLHALVRKMSGKNVFSYKRALDELKYEEVPKTYALLLRGRLRTDTMDVDFPLICSRPYFNDKAAISFENRHVLVAYQHQKAYKSRQAPKY